MSSIEEMVFQALDEASMCWNEALTDGPEKFVEFDSTRCKTIGERLIAAIKKHYETDALLLKPTRIKNLTIPSWCTACGKAKGYAGILVSGEADDADTQPVPQTCMCHSLSPWMNVQSSQSAHTCSWKSE